MELLAETVRLWLWADEIIGAVVGVIVVLCLVREKLVAWPLGVFYVLVTIPQLYEARLYANLVLHVVGFLPLNLYGWYQWLYGGERRDQLPVTRCAVATLLCLGALCLAGALALGWSSATYTDAALPYWDNGVLVMSLAAMWLTARKKIENWMVWFTVNFISVPLYYAQDLPLYAALYALYIPMAVWGYVSWRKSMNAAPSPP